MADDGGGLGFLLAVALDVALTKGSKRYVWLRVINVINWLLFIALIGAVIYITVRYS